jgi:hypothetical protein
MDAFYAARKTFSLIEALEEPRLHWFARRLDVWSNDGSYNL